jgi:hypothetical protein
MSGAGPGSCLQGRDWRLIRLSVSLSTESITRRTPGVSRPEDLINKRAAVHTQDVSGTLPDRKNPAADIAR